MYLLFNKKTFEVIKMTFAQFKEAKDLAFSEESLLQVDDSILHGCGIEGFKQVVTTIQVVARFIRYQCQQFNGGCDSEELNNLHCLFCKRKRVLIV